MFRFLSVVLLSLFVGSNSNAQTQSSVQTLLNSKFSILNNSADQERYNFIQNIKNQECSQILSYYIHHTSADDMYGADYYINDSLRAYFLEEGICIDANPKEAANIYSKNLDILVMGIDAARLGNLYFRGFGVEKNLEKANHYFKLASIAQAPSIWSKHNSSTQYLYVVDENSPEYKTWKLSPLQLSNIFTTGEIGPWELPKPLQDQIDWINSLHTNDGAKIFDVALHLHDGTGGYEKDPLSAIIWMEYLNIYHQSSRTNELFNLWEEELENSSEREW